jgi:predicted amino acid dehydrogenase
MPVAWESHFGSYRQLSQLGVSVLPTDAVPHSASRILPTMDEVLRTFHQQQACLASTLACRFEDHHQNWKELD